MDHSFALTSFLRPLVDPPVPNETVDLDEPEWTSTSSFNSDEITDEMSDCADQQSSQDPAEDHNHVNVSDQAGGATISSERLGMSVAAPTTSMNTATPSQSNTPLLISDSFRRLLHVSASIPFEFWDIFLTFQPEIQVFTLLELLRLCVTSFAVSDPVAQEASTFR